MDPPDIPGPEPETKRPKLRAPAGAADCHFHIFGPQERYPYAEGRAYTPPDALEEGYLKMARALGLSRGVVVQASPQGRDNRRVADAIRALGPGFRGVGVVDSRTPEAELEELTRGGVRGARVNLVAGGGAGLAEVEAIAARIRPFGWHLQFYVDGRTWEDLAPRLARLPVPSVLDHMGHLPAGLGAGHPAFRALLEFLGTGKGWVKLSGAERISAEAFPHRDAWPIARALVERAPGRCVWGTDWPHTRVRLPIPNDGDLLDLLLEYAPEEEARRKILVGNPAELYGLG